MEEEDLLLHEFERREHDVLAGALHVLEVLERREAVPDLPEHVREEEKQGDRAADPDPSLAELAALGRQDERDDDGRAEEERRVLVLEAQSREDAERDPPARVSGPDDANEREDAAHPEERLEAVHRHERVLREEDRREERAQSGEQLGVTPPAELAREHDRDRDLRGARDRGDPPQHGKRAAEQERHLRVHGDEGRGVDVSPVEGAARGRGSTARRGSTRTGSPSRDGARASPPRGELERRKRRPTQPAFARSRCRASLRKLRITRLLPPSSRLFAIRTRGTAPRASGDSAIVGSGTCWPKSSSRTQRRRQLTGEEARGSFFDGAAS